MEEMITHQLSASVDEGILEIVITGEVTKQTIDKLHADAMNMITGESAKAVLCDIRALKGHVDEFSSAYFRTRSIPLDILKLPAAIIDPTTNPDYISFYETTAANAGHMVKWFTDIEAARAWLKSKL